MKRLHSAGMLLLALGLAACGGGQPASAPAAPTTVESTATEAMTETQAVEPMTAMTETKTDDAMAAGEAMTMTEAMTAPQTMTASAMLTETSAMDDAMAMVERPAWQSLPLVDARTGATFTLADFAGKTVFVEPMATWCTNCRQQLNNIKSLRTNLQDDTIVFVALSVETNLDPAALAQYADDAGFDWTFAVISPELLQELVTIFGRTITNPPSTPHFIIRPDGSTGDLVTGIESSEQLISQLQSTGG